jgi:hypothetical protein
MGAAVADARQQRRKIRSGMRLVTVFLRESGV